MPVSAATRPLTVTPAEVFTENQTHHAARETHYAGRHQLGGWLRILLFGAGAAGAWWLLGGGYYAPAAAFLGAVLLAFWALVRWHSHIGYQREHHRLLARLNHDELNRLAGQLDGFDPGLRYLLADAQHPYAADLDVFGKHSLYQLLNRATTRLGQDWLAGWLLRPALAPEVQARQQAAAELAPDVEWLHEWQARARHFPRQQADPRAFSAWLARPDFFRDKPWLKPLLIVLPLLTLLSIGWWVAGGGFWVLVVVQAAVSFLNARLAPARTEYAEQATAMRDALRATQAQLAMFEADGREWQAARLRQLAATLRQASHGAAATQRLGQLSGVAGLFRGREHPLGALLLNSLLLWDLHAMWQLERWKRGLGPELTAVLEVQAELEALVSLAGWQFANPTYATPELSTAPLEVTAEALGHPLIFAASRVSNDFHTEGFGQTAVITGSNMAGKSTFLRTLGLNMVLALAGAVVCARRLRLSPAQVFTAMRTQDNLAESTSSFYAELKRLKLLLDMSAEQLKMKNEELKIVDGVAGNQLPATSYQPTATSQLPVFYLLDEILKGTNSLDRHRGARALLRQLHQRRAAGLISTHDLELAGLQDEWPGQVRNFSFNSTFAQGQIHFDYRLTPGPCRAFNASQLMQLMGIAIDDDGEA